mmetsp:Transcript_29039/g.87155  ORF Transcript_29039/g.87155 Transcript_29039/m.87155 type:complete len:465 (-) Transcript_29039:942-2336(-)
MTGGRQSRRRTATKDTAAADESSVAQPASLTVDVIRKMTVAKLKESLAARQLSTKGKKAELAARLTEAVTAGVDLPPEAPLADEAAPGPASSDEDVPGQPPAAPVDEDVDSRAHSSESREVRGSPRAAAAHAAPSGPHGISPVVAAAAPEGKPGEVVEDNGDGAKASANITDADVPGESVVAVIPATTSADAADAGPLKRSAAESVEADQKKRRRVSHDEDSTVKDKAVEGNASVPGERDKGDAENSSLSWLLVSNLRRPFTLGMLRSLVEEFGPLTEGEGSFKTDRFRTFCVVQYASAADARSAEAALDGLQWPEVTGLTLKAKVHDSDPHKDVVPIPPSIPPSKEQRMATAAPAASERDPKPKDQPSALNEVAVKTLEQLFRKTKAEPPLYWLPVSDDEVSSRKRQRERRGRAHDDHRVVARSGGHYNDRFRRVSPPPRDDYRRPPLRHDFGYGGGNRGGNR